LGSKITFKVVLTTLKTGSGFRTRIRKVIQFIIYSLGSAKVAKEIKDLERRDWQLWAMTLGILLSLAVFIILVYFWWGAPEGGTRIFDKYETMVFFLGFTALVLLFCGYMVLKEMEIKRLKYILIEERIRIETLNKRLEELESLFKVTATVNSRLHLSSILDTITQTVIDCLKADQSSLLLIDETKRELRCEAAYGVGCERTHNKKVSLGEGVAGYVAIKGKPLLLNSEVDSSRFKNFVKKDVDITSALCVPLKVEGKVIGVLNVNRIERKERFDENDLKLLSIFADNAAMAIEKSNLYQRLQSHLEALEQQADLIQAGKMAAMGTLGAGIAHQLNQPLSGIKGFTQAILMETDKKSPFYKDLKTIEEQANYMRDVINNLARFARRSESKKEPIDMNLPIEAALGLLSEQLRLHGIRLIKDFDPQLPYVNADFNQMQQVFVNLITNAREAMDEMPPDTKKELTIITRSTTNHRQAIGQTKEGTMQDQEFVEILFADSGPGIPNEIKDRIYDPFFTTKGPKNTGLGLYLNYRIIEDHKGSIEIKSEPGKGTTFKIILPAIKPRPGRNESEDEDRESG